MIFKVKKESLSKNNSKKKTHQHMFMKFKQNQKNNVHFEMPQKIDYCR